MHRIVVRINWVITCEMVRTSLSRGSTQECPGHSRASPLSGWGTGSIEGTTRVLDFAHTFPYLLLLTPPCIPLWTMSRLQPKKPKAAWQQRWVWAGTRTLCLPAPSIFTFLPRDVGVLASGCPPKTRMLSSFSNPITLLLWLPRPNEHGVLEYFRPKSV